MEQDHRIEYQEIRPSPHAATYVEPLQSPFLKVHKEIRVIETWHCVCDNVFLVKKSTKLVLAL